MKVIPPLTITDVMLISSTITEPSSGSPGTESVYDSGTSYDTGDIAIDVTAHLVYESLADANQGNPLTDDTKWLEIGPTNKWAMFNFVRNTKSEEDVSGEIEVVIQPGVRINSVALLGLEADSVALSMDSEIGSPSENYYTYNENLNTREVFDWYDYFFKDFSRQPSIVLFDLPPYSGAYITITITGVGDVKCGACVLGSYVDIGTVEQQAVSDVLNFSSVTRDFAGATSLMVQRRNVPKTDQRLLIEKSRVNSVRDLRDALNAIPAVWSGIDDDTDDFFESLLILGFYKRFSINLSHPEHAIIDLELEEI